MPINQEYDFLINGLGYMLARDPQTKGRAWNRSGISDAVADSPRDHRSASTGEDYGSMPDDLDHPEIQDDWSGGYGDYRYIQDRPNHFHLSYNFDSRHPGLLFHVQRPQMIPSIKLGGGAAFPSVNFNADYFIDVPLRGVANPPAGAGTVLAVGRGYIAAFTPTKYYQYTNPGLIGNASVFDYAYEATGGGALGFGHRPAIFGSFTYIGNSDGSGFYQRGHDGTTYTVGPLPAQWFTVAAGRMWRSHRRNLIQSVAIGADPLVTGNWSATLALGNGYLTTADAISAQDRVYVGFPDGVYLGDQTGTFSNVTTDIGANVNIDNVRDITTHNGMVVFAEGAHVWGYMPSNGGTSQLRQLWSSVDVRPLGAGANTNAIGASMRGVVTCLAGFGRWLYAGMFTGTYSFVFCGYEASPGLPYVWHPMQWISTDAALESVKVSRIHIDAITTASDGTKIPRRMWIGTDASFGAQAGCTAPTYFWPIPENDGPPMQDLAFTANFAPNAYMEHGVKDWNTPGTYKVWRKLEVMSDTVGSVASPLTVTTRIDGTMTAPLVRNGVFSQPIKDYDYYTNASNTAVGQVSQLQYHSVMSTVSLGPTPIWRSFVERGSQRPRSNDIITAKVRIADGVPDRFGTPIQRPGATMLQELRTFALSSNPFPLIDLSGATIPIVMLPGVQEQEVYQGGNDNPEIVATIRLGVLDASWPTATQIPVNPRGG